MDSIENGTNNVRTASRLRPIFFWLCCTNTQELTLKPEGSQTIVTWTINGNAPFVFKLFLVFASADKMMGENLERGLTNLKAVVAG